MCMNKRLGCQVKSCYRSNPAGLGYAVNELINAIERHLDLIHRCRIAGAHKASAAWAECIARYHGHLLFVQQPLGEFFAGQAQVADLREDVERGLSLECG